MSTSQLLIVDDHALTRAGFAGLLRAAGLDVTVLEADGADAAIDTLRAQRVDLMILDLSLAGRSGLELLRHVRSTHPHVPVLILSGFPERQYALNVMRAGAQGYVCKSSAAEELALAVSTVLKGGRYVSATAADLLLGECLDGGEGRPKHTVLSEREFDVFLKLAAGRGTGEVAGQLFLSPKTVSTYRTRILEKLEMRTNADLTRYALEYGLIQ